MMTPMSSQLMGAASASTLSHQPENSIAYGKKVLVVLAAAIVILTTNVLTSPDRFADYYSYLLITDRLHYHIDEPVITYEALSNFFLISLRWLTRSTAGAVDLAHHFLGFAFIAFITGVGARAEIRWQGLLVVIGCFGALLAFITIRASPAYFLVTVAALEARKGRLRSLFWASVAILFHVSAVLAIVPLFALLAYTRFDRMHWIQRATTPIVVGGLIYLALFVFFKSAITTVLNVILSEVPFLNKYIVYTGSSASQSGITMAKEGSASHLSYAIAISLFTLSCFFVRDEKVAAFRPYILFSYVLFQMLEVSPITAYRQSLFWLIPVILVYPWGQFIRGPVLNACLIICAAGLFLYSSQTVYI